MLITLFTDAGFCPDLRVGVWAAWAKESGQALRRAGILAGEVPHPAEAELKALHNGLFLIGRVIDPPADSRVICQVDSQEVLKALETRKHPREEMRLLAQKLLADYAEQRRWLLSFRHVKGHKGTATPRNAVNTWCDKECKRLLAAARAERLAAGR
ncbi:MAG: hypothetical protein P4L71_20955 [Acetobacteraceae bacterium]|nr:hypothetical protein [Acetobacteraceae bacterium]